MPDTLTSANADLQWDAVVKRDTAQDGRFVYAVVTTGVYCRPACASRRPKRENVRFFADTSSAETAGFRACKRCRPQAEAPKNQQAVMISDICRQIEASETLPVLADLARMAGLSPWHFQRTFKAVTGVTPAAYARACRAQRVRHELRGDSSVTRALYEAGFGSNGRFYEAAHGLLGMTPTDYKKGGDGTEIRFAIGACSLGAILVAQSDKGVCAIALGDDPEVLVRDLQDRFRTARLIGADAAFEAHVAQVVACVEDPQQGLNLPLDIRGTAFQQKVWRALQAVRPGETRSYQDLAQAIGAPKAMRAVAGACAANPLAVVIPCHRVVRQDGQLSGYRWGVERKRALLLREGRLAPVPKG